MEGAGLLEVGVGRSVRRARREERAGDHLHRLEVAVLVPAPHLDHYGLAKYLRPDMQMIMGAATERILKAARVFTPSGIEFRNVLRLEPGRSLSVGPFTITPFLNDHSAYDAYSLLIASRHTGERLFYSGDFRGHGRKARTFQEFLRHPPTGVDVLLMEGTTIGRTSAAAKFPTEEELEGCFIEHIRAANGMVLVWSSGQNIDRLVTVYKACRKTRRQFVIDMYTAEILRAIGKPHGLELKSFSPNRRSFKSSGSDCLGLPSRIRPPAFSRSSWQTRPLALSCSFGRQ